MIKRHLSLFVLGVLVVASAWADVELKPEERDNLGIETEAVQPVETGRQWSASAQVLDVTPLVTTLGELQAAETAAAASKAEAERSERLYREDTNVARKVVDAARTQAITDATRLDTARAQLIGTWGLGIATLPSGARKILADDLLAGRACLARLDLIRSLPATLVKPQVEVRGVDGGKSIAAQWLGRLPQGASSTLAGSGLVRVDAPLAAGSLLDAVLSEPGTSIKGMSVPNAAVVRWHGAEWVYEETSPNTFVRRPVKSGVRVSGRALLAGPASANAKIVKVGARALLGVELGASAPAESDEDE